MIMNRMRAGRLFIAMGVALLWVSFFLWLTGYSPLVVLQIFIESTWMSPGGVISVLTKTSLLILSGLAVALPYRAGLFNIGGEGQIYVGGLAAAVAGGWSLGLVGPLHVVLCLVLGTICGALWGWMAAWLKSSRQVHEVISTIMLNFIAFQFVNELTLGILSGGEGASRTSFIESSAHLPALVTLGAQSTSWGLVLSVGLAIGWSMVLNRTWFGFHVRAVGANPTTCTYAGLPVHRLYGWAMLIGGGCAGLSGAIQVTGVDHTFYARFAGGYGFDGIAVAFLGLCEPWATIPAALAIATLRAADRTLQLDAGVPREMVLILEGILIISIAIFSRYKTQNHE